MKKVQSKIALLLIATLTVSVLATGCTGNSNSTTTLSHVAATTSAAPTEGSKQVQLTDLMGNTVMVPSPANLKSYVITSWKGALGASVLFGQTDKIAAMCDTTQYPWLVKAKAVTMITRSPQCAARARFCVMASCWGPAEKIFCWPASAANP